MRGWCREMMIFSWPFFPFFPALLSCFAFLFLRKEDESELEKKTEEAEKGITKESREREVKSQAAPFSACLRANRNEKRMTKGDDQEQEQSCFALSSVIRNNFDSTGETPLDIRNMKPASSSVSGPVRQFDQSTRGVHGIEVSRILSLACWCILMLFCSVSFFLCQRFVYGSLYTMLREQSTKKKWSAASTLFPFLSFSCSVSGSLQISRSISFKC